MRRRSFLQAAGGLAMAAEAARATEGLVPEVERVNGLPYRVLGRTGCKISVLGFPGLALIHYDQEQSTAGIRKAFERGVNYFDVAPAYGNGQCETKMGIGLEGIPRDRYFLACKTKKRDKAGAREELERSLKLLKTEHFDLYQLHHLRRAEEVQEALGPGGAIETLRAAQKEGKVKHLGFSAHTTKGAVLALQGFHFDTAMFPINFVELLRYKFGREVLDLAHKQQVAVLAIKALSRGGWPKGAQRTRKWWYRATEEAGELELALRFALSQPGVVAAFTPSFLDLFDKAVDAAQKFRPVTPDEVRHLGQIAQTCDSIFQKEETQAAWPQAPRGPLFADSPHEGCCGAWDEA